MRVKVPSSIELITGKPIKFSYKKELKSDDGYQALGLFDGPKRRIEVSLCQTPEQMSETILHELTHAVLYMSGQSERLTQKCEEGIVIAMETLSNVYKLDPKNPAIKWRYIEVSSDP